MTTRFGSSAILTALTLLFALSVTTAPTAGAADPADDAGHSLAWVENSPVLAIGTTGPAVRKWQETMNGWLSMTVPDDPYRLELDGVYGPLTDSVTRRFQASQHVTVDGLVGPQTWRALVSAPSLANAAPAPREPSPPTPANPAAGICSCSESATVDVTLLLDVPSPRCLDLDGGRQWLRIRNDGPATHVSLGSLGSLALDLAAGETVTTRLPVRAYVDKGVHVLMVSRYGDTGPDVWVR